MMQPESAPKAPIGDWIGEGWQMFTRQWPGWIVNMVLFFVIMLIPILPFYLMIFAAQLASGGGEAQPPSPVVLPMIFLLYAVILPLSSFLLSGAYRSALKQLRGESVTVQDLFSGGPYFVRVLGAMLLIALLATLGGALCIFPAFIVLGLFMFTIPLIIDRDLGAIDAMSASFARTKGEWFSFSLFALVLYLLASIGGALCGVGALVTYPLLFTTTAIAYRDLFDVAGAQRFIGQPVPPPSAYAGSSWAQPAPAPPAAAVGTCPKCGARVSSATAKFCNYCGASLRG
jgi:hypothetical protein